VEAEFKEIPGYTNYLASVDGQIFSKLKHRILRSFVNNSGYAYVHVRCDGGAKHQNVCVHKLVALTWLGTRPVNCVVNHKDGNRLNNAVSNLEWCTQSDNVKHAVSQGKGRGETNGNAKLTEKSVRALRELHTTGYYTHVELAEFFGISKSLSAQVCRGVVWKHV
jgi:hypothetical protein